VRGADLRCSELMSVDVSSGFAWTRRAAVHQFVFIHFIPG
jgi:hypothetical protein